MTDLNPYETDPYRPGSTDGRDFLVAQGYPVSGEAGSSADQAGYYSAGYASDQSDPYLSSPANQMVPYPGSTQQPYGQTYSQPYSQQYPYPPAPYGSYGSYGVSAYGGGLYSPRAQEANMLGGWALGLGIASVFMNCMYIGIVFGIPAIILGVKGMRVADEARSTSKGLSIAGLVLGVIGSAISAVIILAVFVTFIGMIQV